jgi:hypothetical protein
VVVIVRPYLAAVACLALACLALAGCGGEKDTAPPDDGAGAVVDPCAEAQALETRVIGDFEQPNALGFSSNSDVVLGPDPVTGATSPPQPPATASDTPGLPTARFDSPRCGTSASGLHIVLENVLDNGYSVQVNNITTAIPNPSGAAYFDASEYTGLSFWGRIGPGSNSTFFASIKERYTQPGTGALFNADERSELLSTGNYCEFNAIDVDGNPGTDATLSQCDAFGKGVGLGAEWRLFKVPFELMRQRAYGRPATQAAPDRRILGLELRVENGPRWDVWLDDVAFYKDAASD